MSVTIERLAHMDLNEIDSLRFPLHNKIARELVDEYLILIGKRSEVAHIDSTYPGFLSCAPGHTVKKLLDDKILNPEDVRIEGCCQDAFEAIIEFGTQSEEIKYHQWLKYIGSKDGMYLKNNYHQLLIHPFDVYWERLKSSPELRDYISEDVHQYLDGILRGEGNRNLFTTMDLARTTEDWDPSEVIHYDHLKIIARVVDHNTKKRIYMKLALSKRGYSTALHPVFTDLWSEVSIDNHEMLWELYNLNIQLPDRNLNLAVRNQATENGLVLAEFSAYMLLENPDELLCNLSDDSILTDCNVITRQRFELTLLKFLNKTKINPRYLLGKYPLLDLLISKMPPPPIKNARKIE
jgi:hypothetical protein